MHRQTCAIDFFPNKINIFSTTYICVIYSSLTTRVWNLVRPVHTVDHEVTYFALVNTLPITTCKLVRFTLVVHCETRK